MAPQYLQNFYIGQIPQMRRRSLPRRIRGLRARRLRKKTKGSACQPCKISTPGAFSACVCDLCGADGVQPGTAAQYGSNLERMHQAERALRDERLELYAQEVQKFLEAQEKARNGG